MGTYAAVVLAGGAARRMGGVDKPALPVGGRPMRDRVLAAVADATPRVLVGAAQAVPAGVRVVREDPPGGGPVAAAAAGLALLPPDTTVVALLAADLPLLTRAAIGDLLKHLDREIPDTEPARGDSAPAPQRRSAAAVAARGGPLRRRPQRPRSGASGARRRTGRASWTGTGGGSRSAVSGGSPRCGQRWTG